MNLVLHEPLGVVVHILPYNYPIVLLAWQAAAALAAGNTCIVKPSELTPLATLRLGEVFSHLPAGVFNVVTAAGEGSSRLVEHPGTDMIAFTGSVATGSKIMAAAAPRIKKLLLELGGSDPFIVLGDAKLDVATRGAVFAAFLNAGQVCTSAERFYVEGADLRRVHGAGARAHGRAPRRRPDGRRRHRRRWSPAALATRSSETIDELVGRGARVAAAAGSRRARPRLLLRADRHRARRSRGVQELRREVFGPIAAVTRVRDVDEAIELANDSDFGLGANIYTSSLETAMRAATELQAGTVWINDPLKDNDAAPFGGFKMSGLGRELGTEGISAFTQAKHVHIDFAQAPSPEWWFPYERPAIAVEEGSVA